MRSSIQTYLNQIFQWVFAVTLLIATSGCSGGQGLQNTLAPDPKLKDSIAVGTPIPSPTPEALPPTPTPAETPPSTPSPDPAPSSSPSPRIKTNLPATDKDYIADLNKIGVFSSADIAPNRSVTRREYVRWLVAAYNRINSTKPTQQIRLATAEAKPAFQDIPTTHPDFTSIQGLAEAGMISSPLSGDATSVLFRPDAPLTREQLISWKLPLDSRQPLPTASLEAVKQTWGFQDAAKIEPKALRAVLADFQSGEQSNIRRVFGYTTLFQPKKTVSLGEVAATIWYFGNSNEGLSARDAVK